MEKQIKCPSDKCNQPLKHNRNLFYACLNADCVLAGRIIPVTKEGKVNQVWIDQLKREGLI